MKIRIQEDVRENMKGLISNIQPFSLQDGPGIRTTVFMKGCNLQCYWCHNPESMSSQLTLQFFGKKCIGCGACVQACPQRREGAIQTARFTSDCALCGACAKACYAEALVLTGQWITVDELMEQLRKDKAVFDQSGGGVTFSGGEPLLQADFLLEVMRNCKDEGISVAVETALCIPAQIIEKLLPYIDVFICDLKAVDPRKHQEGIGADNQLILENIRMVAQHHHNVLVRTPIIPGFNDTPEEIRKNAEFLSSLPGTVKTELLPFHGICENKYQSMSLKYRAAGRSTPTKEQMGSLAEEYKKVGLEVKF